MASKILSTSRVSKAHRPFSNAERCRSLSSYLGQKNFMSRVPVSDRRRKPHNASEMEINIYLRRTFLCDYEAFYWATLVFGFLKARNGPQAFVQFTAFTPVYLAATSRPCLQNEDVLPRSGCTRPAGWAVYRMGQEKHYDSCLIPVAEMRPSSLSLMCQ